MHSTLGILRDLGAFSGFEFFLPVKRISDLPTCQ
jgi:hypothetical protein